MFYLFRPKATKRPPKLWTPLPRLLPLSLVSRIRITMSGIETFEPYSKRISCGSISSRISPRLTKETACCGSKKVRSFPILLWKAQTVSGRLRWNKMGEKLIAGTNWSRFEKASNVEVKAGLLPLPCSARSISGADKATTSPIPVWPSPRPPQAVTPDKPYNKSAQPPPNSLQSESVNKTSDKKHQELETTQKKSVSWDKLVGNARDWSTLSTRWLSHFHTFAEAQATQTRNPWEKLFAKTWAPIKPKPLYSSGTKNTAKTSDTKHWKEKKHCCCWLGKQGQCNDPHRRFDARPRHTNTHVGTNKIDGSTQILYGMVLVGFSNQPRRWREQRTLCAHRRASRTLRYPQLSLQPGLHSSQGSVALDRREA